MELHFPRVPDVFCLPGGTLLPLPPLPQWPVALLAASCLSLRGRGPFPNLSGLALRPPASLARWSRSPCLCHSATTLSAIVVFDLRWAHAPKMPCLESSSVHRPRIERQFAHSCPSPFATYTSTRALLYFASSFSILVFFVSVAGCRGTALISLCTVPLLSSSRDPHTSCCPTSALRHRLLLPHLSILPINCSRPLQQPVDSI